VPGPRRKARKSRAAKSCSRAFALRGEIQKTKCTAPELGSWLLVPTRFEFWQAGESRLHDRFVFDAGANGIWQRHDRAVINRGPRERGHLDVNVNVGTVMPAWAPVLITVRKPRSSMPSCFAMTGTVSISGPSARDQSQ